MNHRTLAVIGLVAAPLLSILSVVLQPDLPAGNAALLASLDAAGWKAAVSAGAFAAAQLPLIAAALGIGHLLRTRAPRLGLTGSALLVVGSFGHAVFGGLSLGFVAMSHDAAHRSTYAALLGTLQSSPAMLFSLLGLVGTVLGLLLLSVGLVRGHVGPRWVGPAVWVFLVVEFVGASVSDLASYVSSTVLLAVFVALAREALRAWETVPEQQPVLV